MKFLSGYGCVSTCIGPIYLFQFHVWLHITEYFSTSDFFEICGYSILYKQVALCYIILYHKIVLPVGWVFDISTEGFQVYFLSKLRTHVCIVCQRLDGAFKCGVFITVCNASVHGWFRLRLNIIYVNTIAVLHYYDWLIAGALSLSACCNISIDWNLFIMLKFETSSSHLITYWRKFLSIGFNIWPWGSRYIRHGFICLWICCSERFVHTNIPFNYSFCEYMFKKLLSSLLYAVHKDRSTGSMGIFSEYPGCNSVWSYRDPMGLWSVSLNIMLSFNFIW